MKAPSEVGAALLSSSGDGFFAALADNVPIIVFATAPDGSIEYYNARWFEYTGLSPDETYTNYGYRQAVHPEDVDRLIECGRNARSKNKPSTTEARYRRYDGVYRWHRVTALPFRGADGNVVRWLGTAIDVDDERSTDRALRALAAALPALVWTAQPNGELNYFSEQWREYLDDLSQLTNEQFFALVHPADHDIFEAWAQAIRTGDPYAVVFRMRRRNSDVYRWHRANAVPLRDGAGNLEQWYGVTIDIHDELTDGPAADRDVEAKIVREIARNTPTLFFMVDADGDVTFANERWSEMTGKPLEELRGAGIRSLMHPDDFQTSATIWQNREKYSDDVVMQYRILAADGRYRWIETRTRPERNERGEITRWFGVGLDIDEHQRTLAALDFIVDAGQSITDIRELTQSLERLADISFSGMADLCTIDVIGDGSGPSRIVVASNGVPEDVADAVAKYPPPPRGSQHPIATALYTGEVAFIPRMDPSFWETAISEDRREGWRVVSPHSYLAVPIKNGDEVFGAITLMRNAMPNPLNRRDLRVVEEVARRVALAISHIRLNEALRRESADRLDQYRRIADYSPQTLWTADAAGNIEWLNKRWYEYTGQSVEESLGIGAADAVNFRGRRDSDSFWQHAHRSAEPFEAERLIRGADGVERWHLVRATPELDEAGKVVRWYGMTLDIDETRRAARTMRVFADLGEALAETIDLQQTLDAAMEVVVPEYADWSYIALADENRDLRIAAVYAMGEARAAKLRTLVGQRFLKSDAVGGSARSYQQRTPHLINSDVRAHANSNILPAALDVFDEIRFTSVLTLPLIVSGAARGTLVLGMSDGARKFNEDDVPFFQDLARRISPAIANAELYERERRVAQSFQEASLPSSLPDVPGFDFNAVYEAGRSEALVGGDWFDAFTLADGRIVLSIGDVAGSGLRAAVMMSNVRQAIRGVAQVHADPSLMLEAADGIVRAQHPDTYITAFVGVLDPYTHALTYQNAGHLRPLLALSGRGVIELEGGGLPLGLRTKQEPANCTFNLPHGSMLVLYTDGLVEATHSFVDGYERVFDALATREVYESSTPAIALHDAVLVDGSKDDVAILTVRIGEIPSGVTYKIQSAWHQARVREVRKALLDELRRGGLSYDAVTIAELILVELTGNLARYAPGESTLSIMWNEGRPTLHILDSGPGYAFAAKLPSDVMSESGRGLFLVAALAESLVVTPRMGGGTHTMVIFNT